MSDFVGQLASKILRSDSKLGNKVKFDYNFKSYMKFDAEDPIFVFLVIELGWQNIFIFSKKSMKVRCYYQSICLLYNFTLCLLNAICNMDTKAKT